MGYKKNEIPGIVEKVLKLVDLTGFEKNFLGSCQEECSKGLPLQELYLSMLISC